MIFTFGTALSYGIFRDPFSETFGLPPVALSAVFAVMLFMLFIGSGLIGVFGTRFSARRLLFACSLATGALAPSLYFLDSISGLAVVFAVLGLTIGTAYVVVASVVPRWFESRRGAATGLIFVGNGLGLFLLPPIWQFVFAEMGVRQGFLLVIATTAVAFFFASLVCRRPNWAEQSSATADEVIEWLTRLGGTRQFQLLFVGVALAFAWYNLLAAYAVDLFVSRGLTVSAASLAFGLIGGVSILSRISGGYLADTMGSRRAFLASLICAAVGTAVLFVPSLPALAVAIFLIGLGLGGTATLYIPMLMNIYSPENDTAIVGVFNVGVGLAVLAMPPLGTASVTYTAGFTVAILLTVAATVVGVWTVAAGTAS
jgi:MFS family permease